MTSTQRPGFDTKQVWILLFAGLALMLVAAGYLFYRMDVQRARLRAYNELAAIGQMKIDQITGWRRERLEDVTKLSQSPFFIRGITAWLSQPNNNAMRDELIRRLKLEPRTGDFADAILIDLEGRVLLSAADDSGPIEAVTMKALTLALQSKQASISELFRGPDGNVYIDVVAPVTAANDQPLALLVLRCAASKFLYPLILSWPIPSRSAETLLIRRDGDDVLFLNELRHRAGAPLSLRYPLAGNDTPAVHALHGDLGLCEAKDYRGVSSLAFLQPVADSPWFMVAKVDVSEILAEAHFRAAAIVAVVTLALLLVGALISLTERRRVADSLHRSAAQLQTQAAELFVANTALISQVEKVKQQADELDRSNKDLEQFAAIASHDLQEPLRMVASYTQLLADRYEGQLDDKARTYIAYAVDGAVRMQRLINDLLTYSRVGARGKTVETTDSHSILGETIANLAAVIEESKALVTSERLPIIRADASQLGQLFQNLLANAIKFRGDDAPTVHVSVLEEKREWVFAFRDNGIGIDPQYAERVFVIFQRLHTRQEYPGTGLGLAVCKRIVERHGGRIWLESQLGKGTTVIFTIPK